MARLHTLGYAKCQGEIGLDALWKKSRSCKLVHDGTYRLQPNCYSDLDVLPKLGLVWGPKKNQRRASMRSWPRQLPPLPILCAPPSMGVEKHIFPKTSVLFRDHQNYNVWSCHQNVWVIFGLAPRNSVEHTWGDLIHWDLLKCQIWEPLFWSTFLFYYIVLIDKNIWTGIYIYMYVSPDLGASICQNESTPQMGMCKSRIKIGEKQIYYHHMTPYNYNTYIHTYKYHMYHSSMYCLY